MTRPVPVTARSGGGDLDVIAALVELWEGSRWSRLEACRTPRQPGFIGGYCVPAGGGRVRTADAVRDRQHPDEIGCLVRLLNRSGWQRLQITGNPGCARGPGGSCWRADGSVVSVRRASLALVPVSGGAAGRARRSDGDALDAIALILDRGHRDPSTLDAIEELVASTGRGPTR